MCCVKVKTLSYLTPRCGSNQTSTQEGVHVYRRCWKLAKHAIADEKPILKLSRA